MTARRISYPLLTLFVTLFSSVFNYAAPVHTPMSGMANWAGRAHNHLEEQQHDHSHLLSLPDWMPGYLIRKMSIPAPIVEESVMNIIQEELKTASRVLPLTAFALLTRPVMKYFRYERLGSGNNFWTPSYEGTLWHLLSARVLTQIASAETIGDGLARGFILSNITPWLSTRFNTLGIPEALADLPAHIWLAQKLMTNMALMSAPVNVHKQPVTFENDQLNQMLAVSVRSPLFDRNFEPVIDIQIHPQNRDNDQLQPSISSSDTTHGWIELHNTCRELGIHYIRLYPVTESGINRLYMKTWRSLQGSKRILIAQYSNAEQPVYWWTDQIMDNQPLSILSANPLAPDVIAHLPGFIKASHFDPANANDATPPLLLVKPALSTAYERYASVTDHGHGLLFFDWNELAENSLLPRITLLTEEVSPHVTLGQLSAISHTQPQQMHPYARIASRIAHDAAWLITAYALDYTTSSAGDKILRYFLGNRKFVNFTL